MLSSCILLVKAQVQDMAEPKRRSRVTGTVMTDYGEVIVSVKNLKLSQKM